jgi:hypothetical protein
MPAFPQLLLTFWWQISKSPELLPQAILIFRGELPELLVSLPDHLTLFRFEAAPTSETVTRRAPLCIRHGLPSTRPARQPFAPIGWHLFPAVRNPTQDLLLCRIKVFPGLSHDRLRSCHRNRNCHQDD